MNQSEVERAVARATGESRRLIRRYGFSLVLDEPEPCADLTLALDCPGCGATLNVDDLSNLPSDLECARCDAVYSFAVDEIYVADRPHPALAGCA
jgi:hypothetical protein